jgi:hypothetical protein
MIDAGHDIRAWSVYKIVSPSGKTYIGKTLSPKERFMDYARLDCKNQRLLHKSLMKYGYENHAVSIIDTFESTADAAKILGTSKSTVCRLIRDEIQRPNIFLKYKDS